jgi:hypothetical protein
MRYGGPSLSTETCTLIAAYILQSNGAAAGTEALSPSTWHRRFHAQRSWRRRDRFPPRTRQAVPAGSKPPNVTALWRRREHSFRSTWLD